MAATVGLAGGMVTVTKDTEARETSQTNVEQAKPLLQVVISDVDGTLFSFGTNRALSQGNRAALQRALDAGVHVSLATGRIPGPWSDRIREELPGLGPGVFSNGSVVVATSGEVIVERTLLPAAMTIMKEYFQGGLADGAGRVHVLVATRWPFAGSSYNSVRYLELAPQGPTWTTKLIQSAGEPDAVLVENLDCVLDDQVFKVVVFTNPKSEACAPMARVVRELQARLEPTGAVVLDCGEKQCEILPNGVNKGTGVQLLLEHLGVDPASALALGDAENDVEMLRLVGVGAAMGNARPSALEAADVVVARNDEDGVAEAIHRFVFGEAPIAAA